MSGICGMINFDGAPVDPELLRKMAEAAAYRGPDGIHYWIEGNVGLAHLALHTTPESVREHQPLVNQRGDLVLTADARIDNRGDLESKLRAKGYLHTDHPTDADYILAAYECWGEDCPKFLVGDFAFAIWDDSKRQLFAARDQMGVRLFHYRQDARNFQWATEARQLLVDPAFPIRYNESQVAQDLVIMGGAESLDSYYQGIQKLGSASSLLFSGDHFRTETYWDFDPSNEIRYSNEEAYVEHFLDLFRQAIRTRLRSVGPVGIFMSGGIDSTSVAAVAAEEMIYCPNGVASRLEAVNWTVQNRQEYSETERSRTVAEKWGFGYREVNVEGCWPLIDFPNAVPHPDEPFTPHSYTFYRASLNAFSTSALPNIWLEGYAGDAAVGGSNLFYYLDLLVRLHWKMLLEEIRNHRMLFGVGYNQLIRDWILQPLLVDPFIHYFRRSLQKCTLPDWLDQEFIKRTNLREWKVRQTPLLVIDLFHKAPSWKDPQKNWHYRIMRIKRDIRIREWYNRFMAEHRADVTGPWNDVRLTQFLLAIPSDQIVKGMNHKLILRRSLKGILPDVIRERRAPRSGTPFYMREFPREPAVLEKARSILKSGYARQFGWVNQKVLNEIINDTDRFQQKWSSLWPYLWLEMWLQTSGKMPQGIG